ncbi:hypothetical protein NLG97_g872 [Lecanicillium saksenae]|uniref:Uncharacterized protein n=1 Tax=Lecanicillium saksenae TaxID=468837 RepID=A0ACC1R5Z2_9HYPO|nr:hypothetical protein NLG97_g872 [Lecanicillium saksenae]
MRFSTTIAMAAMANGAFGALVDVVVAAVGAAADDTGALNKAVLAFNGDIDPVVNAAAKLITDVTNGKKNVDATPGPPLDEDGVFAVVGVITPLNQNSQDLVASLKARKPDVEKGGYCELVQKQSQTIYTVSTALINTVTDPSYRHLC